MLRTFAFDFKIASKSFFETSPMPSFTLNGLERFTLLSEKTASTSLLRNLQKSKKCHFQTLTTFKLN